MGWSALHLIFFVWFVDWLVFTLATRKNTHFPIKGSDTETHPLCWSRGFMQEVPHRNAGEMSECGDPANRDMINRGSW